MRSVRSYRRMRPIPRLYLVNLLLVTQGRHSKRLHVVRKRVCCETGLDWGPIHTVTYLPCSPLQVYRCDTFTYASTETKSRSNACHGKSYGYYGATYILDKGKSVTDKISNNRHRGRSRLTRGPRMTIHMHGPKP
jgi:hypothetical protein